MSDSGLIWLFRVMAGLSALCLTWMAVDVLWEQLQYAYEVWPRAGIKDPARFLLGHVSMIGISGMIFLWGSK